jgi:hypothetical protein
MDWLLAYFFSFVYRKELLLSHAERLELPIDSADTHALTSSEYNLLLNAFHSYLKAELADFVLLIFKKYSHLMI